MDNVIGKWRGQRARHPKVSLRPMFFDGHNPETRIEGELAMMPQILVAAGAAIILLLGFLHLVYTFFTRKFNPRDDELERDMRQVSPRLTSQTTMWKAWIGFNASHSLGLILFGAIYGYLSLFAWTLLVHSAFFVGLGIAFFVSYLLLAKLYWFRRPLIGIALAGSLYILGIVIAIY